MQAKDASKISNSIKELLEFRNKIMKQPDLIVRKVWCKVTDAIIKGDKSCVTYVITNGIIAALTFAGFTVEEHRDDDTIYYEIYWK